MELNKIYHLFLTDCFFLSTEFTNVLCKRDFNSYIKCMKSFFPNVTLDPIDQICFLSVIFDYSGTALKNMIIKMQICFYVQWFLETMETDALNNYIKR